MIRLTFSTCCYHHRVHSKRSPWWHPLSGSWSRPPRRLCRRREQRPPCWPPRKETSTSWMKTSECSCVIGARRGEGTPSQDDIISALSARRRSLASRSLVNEESFLSACVSPFHHVTAAGSERTRVAADWRLLTQSFDGACPQGKSVQGGRDGWTVGWMEE